MGSMIDSLAHRRGRPAGADEAACTFGAGALHSSMAGSPSNVQFMPQKAPLQQFQNHDLHTLFF